MAVEKLYGNRRIESNLREKGIDPEMISMAISNARTELDEKKGLARLIEKKIKTRPLSGLSAGDKRRLATSLLGRGFPPAFIYEALGRATEDFSE
jgi:SOS response regulatory protein OraA/RecX